MATHVRWLAMAACAAGLGGCGLYPAQTDLPYPVYGNPVNPTPVRGYRVECTSVEGVPNFFRDPQFTTGCRQIIVPESRVVIRARG